MNWLAIVKAFFDAITGVSKAVEVRTKPEEIQVSEHTIKKPRLETTELIRRQQKVFNKIKNVPDADVKSFVLEWTDMNEEDTEVMVKNITTRIAEYRRDFPVISGWRRFLKKNK